jgi:hypothetical protein
MSASAEPLAAPVHHDRFGWDWYPDPTGRHPYRALEDGAWTDLVSSKPGGHYRPDHDGGTLARAEYAELAARYAATAVAASPLGEQEPVIEAAVKTESEDAVGLALEFLGWAAIAVAVVAGIVLINQSRGANSTTPGSLGWLVAFGGSIQGLLLVALGRLVRYLRATALLLGRVVQQR